MGQKFSNIYIYMINLVFYTNCQYRGLDYFIKNHINKIETKHIENYSIIKNKDKIPFDILKQADIFIYQPIDKKHGIYSTDTSVENNIMTYLSPNCKIISFPYIYNSSLWILVPPANIDGYIGNYADMDKYINREPIEKLKVKGYSLDEVLQMYSKGEIDFDYEKRFNKSIEILKKKEELCDVKVSEFIEKNIRKHKLFFTQNHPTTCVFIHCVNQILSILGHNHKFDAFSYPENICNLPGEWPHTSYDIKYWNFEYKNNNINNSWYVGHIKNIYNKCDNFFNDIFRRHSFEYMNNMDICQISSIMNYHKKIFDITENDIMFDVGANCGSFVKALTNLQIKKNIHCFEPHPVLSKMTKDLYKNIIMNEVCLSNKNGNVIVNFPQTSLAISSIINRPLFNNLPASDRVKRVECKCFTLDHYCNINNINMINFIKIDVEGAEKMVLEGAKNMFAQKKIKGGMIEIIESQLKDAGTSSTEIEYILKNQGYNIVKTLSANDWYFHIEYLFPLSYSIPLKFVKNAMEIKKTRLFSPLIPADKKSYIYKDEISYNKNYSESYFSFTFKKGGYDCLRHYEILANNSIPYYIDIDEIPNKTMTTFPKSIVKKAMKSLLNKDNVQIFDKYIQDLNEYTINNLTCEKTSDNFIKLINNINNKKSSKHVLMLSNAGFNYSIMTLAYGLRQNLKDNFIDFPKINSLYTKQQFNLYLEDDIEIDRENISDKIKNKLYDYIILGPIGPDESWVNTPMFKNYEELILSSYKKTEIIYIFGGDRPFNIKYPNNFNCYLKTYMKKGICFVRELDDNTEYYHDKTWGNYVTECRLEWDKKIKSSYSIINSIKDYTS
jgi:FkbM family methyltransferase